MIRWHADLSRRDGRWTKKGGRNSDFLHSTCGELFKFTAKLKTALTAIPFSQQTLKHPHRDTITLWRIFSLFISSCAFLFYSHRQIHLTNSLARSLSPSTTLFLYILQQFSFTFDGLLDLCFSHTACLVVYFDDFSSHKHGGDFNWNFSALFRVSDTCTALY